MKHDNTAIIERTHHLMNTPSEQRNITNPLFWLGYMHSLLKKGHSINKQILISIKNYLLSNYQLDWEYIEALSRICKSNPGKDKFCNEITTLLKPAVNKKFKPHTFKIGYDKSKNDPSSYTTVIKVYQQLMTDTYNGQPVKSSIQSILKLNSLFSHNQQERDSLLTVSINKIFYGNKKKITVMATTLHFDSNLKATKQLYYSSDKSLQYNQLETFFKENENVLDFFKNTFSYFLPILFTGSQYINQSFPDSHSKTHALQINWDKSDDETSTYLNIPLSIKSGHQKPNTVPINYLNIGKKILTNKKKSRTIDLNSIKTQNNIIDKALKKDLNNKLSLLFKKSILAQQNIIDTNQYPINLSLKEHGQYLKLNMLILRNPNAYQKRSNIATILREDIIKVNRSSHIRLKWVKLRKNNQKGMLFQIIMPASILNNLQHLIKTTINQLTTSQPKWTLATVKKPFSELKSDKVKTFLNYLFRHLVDKYYPTDPLKDLKILFRKKGMPFIKVGLKFKDSIKYIFFEFDNKLGIGKSFFVAFLTPLLKHQYLETLYHAEIKKNMNSYRVKCNVKSNELTVLFRNEIHDQELELIKVAKMLKVVQNLHLDVMSQNRS